MIQCNEARLLLPTFRFTSKPIISTKAGQDIAVYFEIDNGTQYDGVIRGHRLHPKSTGLTISSFLRIDAMVRAE